MGPEEQEVTILMRSGFDAVREGRHKEAQRIGRRLRRLRHSSAFEIMALAFLDLGKTAKAIVTLEEGVKKAPLVWLLWELLGNCYSDAHRFADAEKAYQQALKVQNCNRDVVHLNRAIAFRRAGALAKADAALRLVKSAELMRRSLALKIRMALKRRRAKAAEDLAVRLLASRSPKKENYDARTESELFLASALGLRGRPQFKEGALSVALKAVDFNPNNAEALKVIREFQSEKPAVLKCFRLLVHGIFADERSSGFYRSADVVAEDGAAAFQLVTLFFPKGERRSLRVEELKVLRKRFRGLPGVYRLSEFCCYPLRGAAT